MFFQSPRDMNPSMEDGYAYAMNPMIPSSLNPAPTPELPPVVSSMTTPQLNYSNRPQYAQGGRVEGLPEMAEAVREQGRHGDTMLAHITPAEALLLRAMGGSGTVNPETGLPEYFFGGLGKLFKKIAGPVLGSILGTVVGGPLGGALGGAIGGSIGHPKQRVGPIAGGIGGFFGGPSLTGGLSALQSGGGLGGMLGGMGSGFGQSTGMLSSGLGGLSNLLGMGGGGSPSAPSSVPGAGVSSGGGLLGNGNLLNTALLGTAVLGTLGRREKTPGPQSFAEAMNQAQPRWRPDQYPREARPYKRRYRPLPREYDPTQEGEHLFFEEEPYGMKRGGYLDGETGGQDDKIPAMLSDGEYVVRADRVSAIGDGNNRAGARKLDEFLENIDRHKGITRFPPKTKSLASYLKNRTMH